MTDRIREALQNLLKEHHIDGTVEYAPSHSGEHLYSVAGVPVPICKLRFPGADNVPENKLIDSSRQLTDDDYSLKGAIAFSEFTLMPLYREAGQLRAKFGTPAAKFVDDGKCKRGVELSIPVAEGPIYLWEKSEWSGNEVLTPIELAATLGMKNGEVANGTKFDKGLHELAKRYGKLIVGGKLFTDCSLSVLGADGAHRTDDSSRASTDEPQAGAPARTEFLGPPAQRQAWPARSRVGIARCCGFSMGPAGARPHLGGGHNESQGFSADGRLVDHPTSAARRAQGTEWNATRDRGCTIALA